MTNADLIAKARALGDDALAVPLLRKLADALEARDEDYEALNDALDRNAQSLLDMARKLEAAERNGARLVEIATRDKLAAEERMRALEAALRTIAEHDGGRWSPDEDGMPTIRQPSPQQIATDALAKTTAANVSELCENCGSPNIAHHDVEGVPLCQKCWDDPSLWEPTAPEAANAQPVS